MSSLMLGNCACAVYRGRLRVAAQGLQVPRVQRAEEAVRSLQRACQPQCQFHSQTKGAEGRVAIGVRTHETLRYTRL